MDFGEALDKLKQGKKLAREGWNDKDMFIYLVREREIDVVDLSGEASLLVKPECKSLWDKITINGHIDMYTAQGTITIGWVASQTDMLTEDWEVVE